MTKLIPFHSKSLQKLRCRKAKSWDIYSLPNTEFRYLSNLFYLLRTPNYTSEKKNKNSQRVCIFPRRAHSLDSLASDVKHDSWKNQRFQSTFLSEYQFMPEKFEIESPHLFHCSSSRDFEWSLNGRTFLGRWKYGVFHFFSLASTTTTSSSTTSAFLCLPSVPHMEQD